MENYFNYFTEIEEYFWKKRGTSLLLSTLDWALIDSWKEARIPLEAVLKGIDRAFEKYDARRHKVRKVNSLAYCQQEVLAALQEQQRATLQHPSGGEPFAREELAKFFGNNAGILEKAARQFDEQGRAESAATFRALAVSLGELETAARSDAPLNLEEVERRLTVLEEKMFSTLLAVTDEQELVAIRSEMDRALAPLRHKMGAEQIAQLQKQFLQRKLLEKAALPRLSLFYL
ncbi:MAG: hypothetical protein HY648_03230 [Acidobacteria bacterium]|nr:hypothetical protein [Acidobacteriota bacterium]